MENQISLTPALPQTMQREFKVMQWVAGAVLTTCLFSVTSGLFESLRTAFPWWTAISISFGIAIAFDLACAVFFFAVINVFARGKIGRAAWNMYLASAAGLLVVVLFIGNMVIENVHAVAAKTRGFKFAVNYISDPILLNAQLQKREIDSTIRAIDATMLDIGKSMRQAGTAASAFSQSISDTNLTGKQRSNQIWGAMRANKTQENLGNQLTRLNDQRRLLLTAKLNASSRVDSILMMLKANNALKSPEDVIEARLGINFLQNISWAEVVIMGFAVFALGFIKAVREGHWYYHDVEMKSAHALAPATISSGADVSPILSENSAPAALPEPIRYPFDEGDKEGAKDWLEFRLLTGQYNDNQFGGDFSETVRRIGGRKNKSCLEYRVKSVRKFMQSASAEAIQARVDELIQKHNWQEYGIKETAETTH